MAVLTDPHPFELDLDPFKPSSDDEYGEYGEFDGDRGYAEQPLTSEPPMAEDVPLTSEPPIATEPALISEPTAASGDAVAGAEPMEC
jgi:hypothetical protein